MAKMMKEDPEKYPTENDTVDAALIRASNKKGTYAKINQFKDTYDHFAWTIALAPADDPQILGMCVIYNPQGVYYGGTIAAPVIGKIFENILPYLGIEKQ